MRCAGFKRISYHAINVVLLWCGTCREILATISRCWVIAALLHDIGEDRLHRALLHKTNI